MYQRICKFLSLIFNFEIHEFIFLLKLSKESFKLVNMATRVAEIIQNWTNWFLLYRQTKIDCYENCILLYFCLAFYRSRSYVSVELDLYEINKKAPLIILYAHLPAVSHDFFCFAIALWQLWEYSTFLILNVSKLFIVETSDCWLTSLFYT